MYASELDMQACELAKENASRNFPDGQIRVFEADPAKFFEVRN
jgi:predicted RNA methylase